MKLIESYQELSKLIFSYLKKDVMTNCFICKEEWISEIQNKNIYYIEDENNLFLLKDRNEFWVLNYYLNNLNVKNIEMKLKNEFLKPYVVEVVGKNALDQKYNKQQEFFLKLGMEKKLERERFYKPENVAVMDWKIYKKEELSKDYEKYVVSLANRTDIKNVMNLLTSSFNLYYGCIPTIQKLSKDLDEKSVIVARFGDKIIGVLHFQNNKKQAEIRHLVVHEDFRKKGIASMLMRKYETTINNNNNKYVWTGAENEAAQKLYQDFGYKKDGFVSSVFIKN